MTKSVTDADGTHYLEREFRAMMRDPQTSFFLDSEILDGFWYWDLTDPIHEWMSPGFWRALGFDPDERQHLASEWKDLIFPEDGRAAEECFRRHREDPSIPYDQLVRYRTADGGTVVVRCQGTAIRKDGVPTRMMGIHTIVHDSRRQDLDRQMSQLVEMSGDAILVWSEEQGVLRWNDGAARLYGIREFDARGRNPNTLTKASYRDGWDDVKSSLDSGQEWFGEVHRCDAHGAEIVTSSRFQRLVIAGGKTLILQSDRDVTERHARAEKQIMLSREINHRVKNLFSVIQGLVRLSARHETDVRKFGDKVVSRIKALATAHLLGMEDHSDETQIAGLDMRDLVDVILKPYRPIVQGSRIQGPPVILPKRVINPLALILHELATNTLKHGAWSKPGLGHLSIDWKIMPTETNSNRLEMRWRETIKGTEMPNKTSEENSTDTGYGSKLIDMSARQLEARLDRDWSRGGLCLTMRFSIEEEAG